MRLQNQILLLLIPLTVLPLLTLGWAAYDQLQRTAEQRTLSEVETLLDQTQQMFEARLRTAAATAETIARLRAVQRYAASPEDENRYILLQPSILKLLGEYQRTYPDYYEIRILMPDGYEDARATARPLRNLNDHEAEMEYFRRAAASPDGRYQGLLDNPDTGTLAVYTVRPIDVLDRTRDPVGQRPPREGYVVLTADTGFLSEHASQYRFGVTGRLLFVDGRGEVLFSPVAPEIGGHLPPEVLVMTQDDLTPVRPIIIDAAYEGPDHHHQVVVRRLNDSLYAVALLEESELLADSRRLALTVTGIVLATVLATTVMLYMLLNRIVVRPIRRLDRVASQIGRGELDVDIDPATGQQGEIGRLGETLRTMALNLKRSTEQVRYLAYHDALTGLPNRSMFSDYLQRALSLAERHGDRLAVLFIDVDNFKQVNDSLGHHAGDDLLKQVAERIGQCLRSADLIGRAHPDGEDNMVARLGGDEFTVLLYDVGNSVSASRVASRILDALALPIHVADHPITVSASIGLTLSPEDGRDPATLLRNADMAMYRAKDSGRNTFQFYTESMNEMARDRLFMEGKLRRALSNGEFELHYQPVVDLASGRVVGAEALLRWHEPDEGMIPPGRFMGFAEDSGLIVPIGEWVLHEACRQNQAWQCAGLPPISIAVNISAVQVRRVELNVLLEQVLGESRLEPRWLDLEITETSLLTGEARAARLLGKLRELGLKISLDDFGTGYSSLSYLRRFPIDTLKIDRSFVRDIAEDPDDEAIASTIVAMGRRLKLSVIAEGIETEAQLNLLGSHGCGLGQGYLFSPPVPAVQFRKLLEEGYEQPATRAALASGPTG
ncbi:MAG: EAL domain-containing protein [Chromatiales bacterium]|jgi:diguanylate cyclase (GGDEF)-like protein